MASKITCTCGHSWDKSDSSKKDATVCHICGKNNMKDGGWLEKYAEGGRMQEHQENYNDSSVSIPEGFVGMGNNTQGRNYSPAWGGQFAMGGSLPGSVGFTYARTQSPAPSEGPYAKKTLPSAQNGKYLENYLNQMNQDYKDWYSVDRGHDDGFDSFYYDNLHKQDPMLTETRPAWELINPKYPKDPWYVDELDLTEQDKKRMQSGKLTGKLIKDYTTTNRDTSMDQYNSDLTKYLMHKNTSKQENGGMTYYQHGLDWKPKSISKNGSFVPMADEGMELVDPPIDPPVDLPKDPVTPTPLPMSPLMTARGNRAKEKMESRMMTIKDPRKIRMTTGLAINPNKDLTSGNYNMGDMDELMKRAKSKNISEEDAWNLASIAFQETGWGKTDGNIGHIIGKYGEGDMYDAFINAYQTKMKEADRLKIKDPYSRLQVYNGMGTITPKTEKNYHGFEMKKIYGVPIPKEGLSMKKNPLYGKQITDVRDNVLRKNPEFTKYMSSYYKKKDGGVIEDDRGQWDHPGEVTKINSNQITMKGVPYPVLGISNTGDRKMMYPEQEYTFKGKTVTEYPQKKKNGGWLDKYN